MRTVQEANELIKSQGINIVREALLLVTAEEALELITNCCSVSETHKTKYDKVVKDLTALIEIYNK